jgi:hypothetical protein
VNVPLVSSTKPAPAVHTTLESLRVIHLARSDVIVSDALPATLTSPVDRVEVTEVRVSCVSEHDPPVTANISCAEKELLATLKADTVRTPPDTSANP